MSSLVISIDPARAIVNAKPRLAKKREKKIVIEGPHYYPDVPHENAVFAVAAARIDAKRS